ncbi:MAG TPA: K(+)-transporting ATPase subunit F [bacterium]|nr:K(+)-transporting ATPase subunit F [bacterium]
MNGFFVALAGVLSIGLFVYLVCALLKPEWFV